MNTQKTLDTGRLTTINPNQLAADITSAAGGTWWDQTYRPVQWLDDPANERDQRIQNDAVLYSYLMSLPYSPTQRTLDNPYVYYRIDTRKESYTNLRFPLTAADLFLYVEEPKLFFPNYALHLPQSGQQLIVDEVDYDLSNGWTDAGGEVANIKVKVRTLYGAATTANAGDQVEPGLPEFGELGASSDTGMLLPGDPQFQIMSMYGWNVKTSVLQNNSNMGGGQYGTHEANKDYAELRAKQAMQTEIIHGKRNARVDASDPTNIIYRSAGLMEQIGDNVMSVDGTGNGLIWANLSDFLDEMFESQNSSNMKDAFFGDRLFMEARGTARQEGAASEVDYNPDLGTDSFTITTDGGKTVTVNRASFAFPKATADWGIVLDKGVLTTASYEGFPGMVWKDNVEVGEDEITKETSVLYGSVSTILTDPSTSGIIRSTGSGANVVRGLNEGQYL